MSTRQKVNWDTSFGVVRIDKEKLLESLFDKALAKWKERFRRAEREASVLLLEVVQDLELAKEFIEFLKEDGSKKC